MFVVSGVVSVMVLAGYELGVSESIAMVILIGFSVDYLIHLAAHYVLCPLPNRYERTHEAIKEIGISIFSGGITTFGSGVFLFGGTIIFFQKFALVICSTVVIAMTVSLVYFIALLHAFGPQGTNGDIDDFKRRFFEYWRNTSKDGEIKLTQVGKTQSIATLHQSSRSYPTKEKK